MSEDEYRRKAAEMRAKAKQATLLSVRRECEALALRYLRLAEMAETDRVIAYRQGSFMPQSARPSPTAIDTPAADP